MLGYVASQFLRVLSSLILTRLLVPEMFGVMAVVSMVQVVVWMLSDIGIRQAIIQSENGDNQAFLDTAWTLQVIRGGIICVICCIIAFGFDRAGSYGWFPAGSVYDAPELPALIAVTSLTAVIVGFQSSKVVSSSRHMDLGRVTAIEFYVQIVSLVVAVILGWLTHSIWSFVAASLVSSIVSTVLSHTYLPGPGNRFHLERATVGSIIRFGRWIVLSSFCTVLAANGDRILLAGWMDPTMLGLYMVAFNLVALFEGAGGRLFSSVAMPAISKVAREQPANVRSVYFKFRLLFDLFFVAGSGAIYGGGEALISVLYDERYAGAGQIIKVLSLSLLIARYGVASSVYVALGEPRYLSLLSLVKTLCLFIVVPLSYHMYGFEGALWGIALHGLPIIPMTFRVNARYQLNSLAFELLILCAWPISYISSLSAIAIVQYAVAQV